PANVGSACRRLPDATDLKVMTIAPQDMRRRHWSGWREPCLRKAGTAAPTSPRRPGALPADECLVTRAPVPFAPMALMPAIGSARGLAALGQQKSLDTGPHRADGVGSTGRGYRGRGCRAT